MKGTRIILNGHVSVFGINIPIHWTGDVQDGVSEPVSIPALHFTGTIATTEHTE